MIKKKPQHTLSQISKMEFQAKKRKPKRKINNTMNGEYVCERKWNGKKK